MDYFYEDIEDKIIDKMDYDCYIDFVVDDNGKEFYRFFKSSGKLEKV